MSSFNGEAFAELVIILIIAGLFFYGSTDIENLTTAPTND